MDGMTDEPKRWSDAATNPIADIEAEREGFARIAAAMDAGELPPYDVGEVVKITGSATSDGTYRVRDLDPSVVGVRVNADGTVTLPRPPTFEQLKRTLAKELAAVTVDVMVTRAKREQPIAVQPIAVALTELREGALVEIDLSAGTAREVAPPPYVPGCRCGCMDGKPRG
jgi:hypothetical protein